MKTKSLLLLLLASVCLVPAARAFEGKMDMTITNAKDPGKTRNLSLAIKGERVRSDGPPLADSGMANMGAVATILDRGKHERTILFLDKKTYLTRSAEAKVGTKIGDNFTKLQYKATGQKEKIAGEDAVQYVSTNIEDGSYHELWVTAEAGKFLESTQGIGGSVDPGELSAQSLWTQFAFKENFIILRSIIRESAGGAERYHLEVTKVDRTPPPDSFFEIPSDFKKVDMHQHKSSDGM